MEPTTGKTGLHAETVTGVDGRRMAAFVDYGPGGYVTTPAVTGWCDRETAERVREQLGRMEWTA